MESLHKLLPSSSCLSLSTADNAKVFECFHEKDEEPKPYLLIVDVSICWDYLILFPHLRFIIMQAQTRQNATNTYWIFHGPLLWCLIVELIAGNCFLINIFKTVLQSRANRSQARTLHHRLLYYLTSGKLQ